MEGRAGIGSYVSWIALAAAFTPVMLDLAHTLAVQPEHRVILVAPILLLLGLRGDAASGSSRRLAAGSAIAIGVGLELFGLASGTRWIARMGLPIAAVGMAGWTGWPPVVLAALLFLAIPIPDTFLLQTSPALENIVVAAASAILRALGAAVQASGISLVASASQLNLHPMDGGASLATVLGGLGWYASARVGEGIGHAARRAALLCLLALPLQVLVVVLAGALLASDMLDASRFWLRHGGWISVFLVGLACVHRSSPGAAARASARAAGGAFG